MNHISYQDGYLTHLLLPECSPVVGPRLHLSWCPCPTCPGEVGKHGAASCCLRSHLDHVDSSFERMCQLTYLNMSLGSIDLTSFAALPFWLRLVRLYPFSFVVLCFDVDWSWFLILLQSNGVTHSDSQRSQFFQIWSPSLRVWRQSLKCQGLLRHCSSWNSLRLCYNFLCQQHSKSSSTLTSLRLRTLKYFAHAPIWCNQTWYSFFGCFFRHLYSLCSLSSRFRYSGSRSLQPHLSALVSSPNWSAA